MENEMIRVNIRIAPELHEWFKLRSQKTGVSMNGLMYLALEQHAQQQMIMPLIPSMMDELKKQG